MSRRPPNPASWLWALGAAGMVMAARWREISLHGGDTPYLDQWLVEGRQILLPWLEGKLTLLDFFRPHHEHAPAWTRFIFWLEAVICRQWDPQLQATVNAVLMGGYVGIFSAWVRRSLPLLPALALTLLAVTLASLPHSWENIVWGFQSHMPLALLFVFVYLRGMFARPPGSAGWWFAQAAGLAALFTLGSMWAAPLAVVLVLLWTGDWDGKRLLAAGFLALAGVALLLAARAQQPVTGAYAMGATSLPQFLAAWLMQLGWPSAWPGAALLVNLPVIFLALRLRGKREAGALDRTVLALGLWAAAQAAAFAYARGSYIGFVSRYGDLLALGVLANGVALWRLFDAGQRGAKILVTLLALGWGATVGLGLKEINVQGHTLYFHEHDTQWNQVRRAAVSQYLASKDQSILVSPEARTVLFPDPAVVVEVLDNSALAAMLPFSVRTDSGKTFGDFSSEVSRDLRALWLEFACCGGLLLLAGIILSLSRNDAVALGGTRPLDAFSTARDKPTRPEAGFHLSEHAFGEAVPPIHAGATAVALAVLALGSGALLFLWPQPFEFRVERRWAQFLTPAGTVPDLSFRITSETPFPKDRLIGGAALWPETFRNTFFGTNIDGPSFTGIAQSNAFPLSAPWYVVPYAGYPASEGNVLRFRFEDATGQVIEEIACPGPNPGPGMTDIGFWEIDARRHTGQLGRLVLVDQRGEAEGWVAAAPPYAVADGPKIAAKLRRSWAAEGTLSGLRSLQVIAAGLGLLSIGCALAAWSNRRRRAGEIR